MVCMLSVVFFGLFVRIDTATNFCTLGGRGRQQCGVASYLKLNTIVDSSWIKNIMLFSPMCSTLFIFQGV
ncbi:hypothetical protein JHK85_047987 [Glycine max]|nr:hypothetical protein JHK85_047987 [Glycine max]KHN09843.1 hypothetical protein glysoja_017144 [Glycine soja]